MFLQRLCSLIFLFLTTAAALSVKAAAPGIEPIIHQQQQLYEGGRLLRAGRHVQQLQHQQQKQALVPAVANSSGLLVLNEKEMLASSPQYVVGI